MKFVSCRNTDIKDVFMLAPQVKDFEWVKKEVSGRAKFENRFLRIKDKINSMQFRDNLQGVYGFVDEKVFERNKKLLMILK